MPRRNKPHRNSVKSKRVGSSHNLLFLLYPLLYVPFFIGSQLVLGANPYFWSAHHPPAMRQTQKVKDLKASWMDIIYLSNKIKDQCREKLRGGAPPVVKKFNTDNVHLQKFLAVLRSLNFFTLFPDHKKCMLQQKNTEDNLCSLCLLRSMVVKINEPKGHKFIKPNELASVFPEDCLSTNLFENLKLIFSLLFTVVSNMESMVLFRVLNGNNSLQASLQSSDFIHDETRLVVVASKKSFICNLLEPFEHKKRRWYLKACLTVDGEVWFKSNHGFKNFSLEDPRKDVQNVTMVLYEESNQLPSGDSSYVYSGMKENEILRKCTANRKKDRHNSTEERKKDRHDPTTEARRKLEREDRHKPTEERKKDRHQHPTTEARKEHDKEDRHKPTEERKKDRHQHPTTEARRQHDREDRHLFSGSFRQALKNLKCDTGMDFVCAICVELRSRSSCVSVLKLDPELQCKFLIDAEITKSKDGKLYVCNNCRSSVEKGKEPSRAMYEFLGFLDYPLDFKKLLETKCQDPSKIELNRLEDFLLKLAIPFIRIAHLPSGSYCQVKGDLIMISSKIETTLKKILPIPQNLLPISFKRKLAYKGHFIEEWVDRLKVLTYYNWFKVNNPLYEDFTFDEEILQSFKDEIVRANCQDQPGEEDEEPDEEVETDEENEADEEDEADETVEEDENICDTFSLILDKYQEDPSLPTVSNVLANMIVKFEDEYQIDEASVLIAEPEDEFYNEDDVEEAEEDLFPIPNSDIDTSDFAKEDVEIFEAVQELVCELDYEKVIKKDVCKCTVSRNINLVGQLHLDLTKHNPVNEILNNYISGHLEALNKLKKVLWERKQSARFCPHKTAANIVFERFLNTPNDPDKIKAFIKNQKEKITFMGNKLFVAPAEEGKWKNWGDDMFLEEKLFPDLFPYGIGGYLSSNFIKNSNLGFANYVKSRLLSANDKFRKDKTYLFFLLLVKEMVEMKRSEQTFFRKATKAANLTPHDVQNLSPELLVRYNNAFSAFKTIRGTSAYFQGIKKNLNAFVRQKGAPTLFASFSSAEFAWDETIHQIFEAVTRTQVPLDFIRDKDASWKRKFVTENVVQSSLHFSKRTRKLLALLGNKSFSPFEHKGRKFIVAHYFARIEFQVCKM